MTDQPFQVIADLYAQAWSSQDPNSVASFYAEEGQIIINQGDPHLGRAGLSAMAAGFMAEFPDMVLTADVARLSGNHALLAWTLEGHHTETKNHVKVSGWEEWELNEEMKVKASLGWFDAEDYENQIANGSISSIVPKTERDTGTSS